MDIIYIWLEQIYVDFIDYCDHMGVSESTKLAEVGIFQKARRRIKS